MGDDSANRIPRSGLLSQHFKPGQSGNPSGRPKIDFRIRALAREQTELALNTLVEICKTGDKDNARVAAAVAILDRGWGKPAQAHIVDVQEREHMSQLDEQELIAIALGDAAKKATEDKPA